MYYSFFPSKIELEKEDKMKNRIRILVTSDVHGYVYHYQYSDHSEANFGFARLHTLIQSLKDENTILIDNGDVLQGSPLSFYHYHQEKDSVSPMTFVMKEMGYDYVNLGNHDFNYGTKALFDHLGALSIPCITSNMLYQQEPVGPTYVIHEVLGKKIAIFGLVTHYIPNWEKEENLKNLSFLDAYETAKKTVEFIYDLEHPDFIVGVYHGGFEKDLTTGKPTEELTGENQGYEMLKIPHLDLLITGHQHRSLCGTAFGAAYTQTTDKGAELACIDIDLTNNTITPTILPVDVMPSSDIEQMVQSEEDRCQLWLDTPLGKTEIDLEVQDEFEARLHKHQIITFLNQVQMDATGADLSSTALFQGATGFKKEITMRDLVSTYVYPNSLVVKEITGKQLKDYLEQCAEYWTITSERIAVSPTFSNPKPQHYNYDMVDGVNYTIKVTNDIGQRIVSLTYHDQPVLEDMKFTIALNNYRASGGGNYFMFPKAKTIKVYTEDMVEVLAQYILDYPTIQFEPVHNIEVIR